MEGSGGTPPCILIGHSHNRTAASPAREPSSPVGPPHSYREHNNGEGFGVSWWLLRGCAPRNEGVSTFRTQVMPQSSGSLNSYWDILKPCCIQRQYANPKRRKHFLQSVKPNKRYTIVPLVTDTHPVEWSLYW